MDAFLQKPRKRNWRLFTEAHAIRRNSIAREDVKKLKNYLIKAAADNNLQRNNFGMNPVIRDMQTAVIVSEEIGMKGSVITGIMLHEIVKNNMLSLEDVRAAFGTTWQSIIKGLVKTNELYAKSPAIETRTSATCPVIRRRYAGDTYIMIADRVNIMRLIKHDSNEEDRIRLPNEAAYLYAPLAQKLGFTKSSRNWKTCTSKYSQKGNLLLYKG